jgi:hypothetical protein
MFQVEDITTGDHRLVTRSKARVVANEDPQKKGRIRVFHPLLGETGFIPYLSAPGSFTVPEVDDVVFLECEAGYPTHSIAWGNLNSETLGAPDFPTEFQRVTPSNRGFFTPGGHLIELDDGKGPLSTGQGVRITTSGGNLITILEDDTAEQGLITLETAGGAKFEIDGTKDTITLETSSGNSFIVDPQSINFSDSFGNTITTDAEGIDINDVNGNDITMSATGIAIEDVTGNTITTSATGIKIKDSVGAELNLATGKVALGNSTGELFMQLVTLLQAFTTAAPTLVSTAVGPGVMNPALVTAIAQATTVLTAIQGTL